MQSENFIDVTLIEPKLKHPTIFDKFDVLSDNESFIIRNDHDPKPLYYQMLAMRGPVFNWEYLENGPEIWQVRITRTGEQSETVGEIVAKDIRKVEVFKKMGIDFCCGGKKTLEEACSEKSIDVLKVKEALNAMDQVKSDPSPDYSNWPADLLIDYILRIHHSYVRKSLPEMDQMVTKVFRVHGAYQPYLEEVYNLVQRLIPEMMSHMSKEEEILFPYIKKLVTADENGVAPDASNFGSVKNPVAVMEEEHEAAGGILAEIRRLTNDFTPPAEACTSFRYLYSLLNDFEEDLHKHVHLENNILFPKALLLEQKFN